MNKPRKLRLSRLRTAWLLKGSDLPGCLVTTVALPVLVTAAVLHRKK